MSDANQMLREDHRKVKELFREFESATDSRQKKRIAEEAIKELDIHTKIEEKIYYPAIRKQDDDGNELVEEAEQEHDVVERLAKDLKRMGSVNDEYEAKFKVMAENVKHHIEEEEMQMLPMAAEEGMDRLRELGEKMGMEKVRLMKSASRSRNGSRTNGARATTKRPARAATRSRSRAGTTRSRTTASRGATRVRTTASRSGTRSRATAPRGAARVRTTASRSGTRSRTTAGRAKPPTASSRTRSTTVRSRAGAKPSTSRGASRSSARPTRRPTTRSRSAARSR